MSTRVLLAIGDDGERHALSDLLASLGAEPAAVGTLGEARARIGEAPWHLVVADLHLPDGSGLELLEAGRCVLLHDDEEGRLAHRLRRAGAYASCGRRLVADRLPVLLRPRDGIGALPGMVGDTPAMRRLFERVRRAGDSHATVLIEGESGTGKELVARALHEFSPRAAGPYVALNCAALSPNLLESELFGHEKGAFTGADRARRGRFEVADGGTLLLDEIGELDLALQAKLLRALEEMEVVRVGGHHARPVDVRVLAATNRNLRRRVEEGAFREDLFYRLHVVRVTVPPLRDRRGDIPLLVASMAGELGGRHGLRPASFSEAALRTLAEARWPGNVRELRNLVERLLLLSPDGRIEREDLPAELRGAEPRADHGISMRPIAEVERELIRNTLRDLDGNREQAARVLGISTRTLYRRIKELGLS